MKEKLTLYRDMSAAQMHDWLKEHYDDFPKVNQKTVFNFVHWVRRKQLKNRKPIFETSALDT